MSRGTIAKLGIAPGDMIRVSTRRGVVELASRQDDGVPDGVVFIPFANGRPQMPAQEFLTGFLNADNKIQGRPVGVAVDAKGALLVADDVGGIVWRVAPTDRRGAE